jgi:hypothetical protein
MPKAFGQQNRMQNRNFKTDTSGWQFDGLGSPSYGGDEHEHEHEHEHES